MRLILLGVVLLCGCSQYRIINPGGDPAWIVARQSYVQREYTRRTGSKTSVLAFTDIEARQVWISRDVPIDQVIGATINETGHIAYQSGVDLWPVIVPMDGGGFTATCSDMPDSAKAIRAARDATIVSQECQ